MTTSPRVLVTGKQLAAEAVAILDGIGARLDYMSGAVTAPTLIEQLREGPTAAILMRGNPPVEAAVLAAAPDLRVIAKHGAGIDSVDLDAATRAGVVVMVAADANAPAVAEHTMALILALGRDVPALAASTRSGTWLRGTYAGREIRGRTLGIVGFGRIGRRVAELGRAVGLEVIALPRHPGSVDPRLAREAATLSELLAESDIVSLHAPLGPEMRGLIGKEALAAMKRGALLVNTARGALVDEPALIEALENGHIAGAALDTVVDEPPDPARPILRAPNVLITPHVAAMTAESIVRMGVEAARNIAAVLSGTALDRNAVANPSVLDRA